ncbi:MAG: hypothetical protein NT080_14220 [Spirochaetes bacterium]|nr:hypothetical protein [Spirochaetota bacterium]
MTIIILAPRVSSEDQGGEADATLFAQSYARAIAAELAAGGFAVVPTPQTGVDPAGQPGADLPAAAADDPSGIRALAAAALGANVRFTASVDVHVRNKRATYSAIVVDSLYETVVAGDAGTTYAGLTALNVLKDSAFVLRNRVERSLVDQSRTGNGVPIPYSLVFLRALDGAEIFFGGDERPVAVASGGKILLPYLPVPEGSGLAFTIKKDGYNDIVGTTRLLRKVREVKLPPMRPVVTRALTLSWGLERSLGGGIGYRHYLLPDRFFLFAEDDFYFQYDFRPDSWTVPHNDLYAGVGFYPFSFPSSRFRISFANGMGILGTVLPQPDMIDRFFLDAVIIPFSTQFEAYVLG